MSENNEDNRRLLAAEIASGMDLDDLVSCTISYLMEQYEKDKELFIDDWNQTFPSPDELE